MTKADLEKIEGNNTPARFLRDELPRIDVRDAQFDTPDYRKVMCDYMGVAAITLPDSMEYQIIPAPVLTDDRRYAIDSTRRKIIYCEKPNSDMIMEDATKALQNVVRDFPYSHWSW